MALRSLASVALIALGALGCSSAPRASSGATSADGGVPFSGDDDGGAGAVSPTGGNGGGGGDDDASSASPPVQPSDGGAVEAGTDGSAASGGALHVVMGTNGAPGHIVDGAGNPIHLHGVDRSGTEFACTSGGFFDGPADQASIDAMKTWHVNAVRVPLNEDCWLGINGVAAAYGGTNYQSTIQSWVNLLTQNGMIVIVDLHWTAPGTTLANAQVPMADADHSPLVWSQIAKMFASNGTVIFDLFNEPYITDWGCWVSGGQCAQLNGTTYAVAGMASLLQAVRNAGAENVVVLGGLAYSIDMSQWVASVKSIPTLAAPLNGISIANIAASWHAYDFNSEQSGCPSQYNGYGAALQCNSAAVTAMNTSATSVLAAGFPLVIGEAGISAFSTSTAALFSSTQVTDIEGWLDNLLTWAESEGQGYLAWSWNTDTDPVLITDYTGTPTVDFGQTYQAHLKSF
jgi:endoglucanase